MRKLLWSSPKTIDKLDKTLRNGSVILAEGDTVFGLLADVSEKGHARLDYIKNRSNKPYLILVHDIKKALNFIEKETIHNIQIEKIIKTCWPGPVTLLFPAKKSISSYAKSSNETVALRIPNHKGLLQLLSRRDGLFSTSANKSGESIPHSLEDVDKDIINNITSVVINDDHHHGTNLPSTIIDCTQEQLVIVRHGNFDASNLIK
ncbi:MAG TPA: L-threonylcarbamoyladenylate synthase [Candidatus Babeliales bacterium]|nr:L-threonylcarbamoyladenylate synthase [Candidatus Babeliales bacterium]